jgi:hypothetical protein
MNGQLAEAAVDDFITNTWIRDHFQRNADSVKETIRLAIKEAPKENEDTPEKNHILHQLSARAKDEVSLRKKLSSKYTSGTYKEGDDIADSDHVWDLAGARVLVYFPDDIPRVLKLVLDRFPDLASKPFIRDGHRAYKPQPKKDWNDTAEEDGEVAVGRINQDALGPWREAESDDVVRHWKHYGYTVSSASRCE